MWVLDGSLHPDEVEDACGLVLPEGEYETLAGFLLDRFQRVPDLGDTVDHDGWMLEVAEMERLRVTSVILRAPEASAHDEEPPDGSGSPSSADEAAPR